MPPFPNNLTLNEFKAKLRNERRVELSFEDHRFWDIRRWKIADQTTDIYGVDITKKEDGSFSYKKVLVEKRIFKDCMCIRFHNRRGILIRNWNKIQDGEPYPGGNNPPGV